MTGAFTVAAANHLLADVFAPWIKVLDLRVEALNGNCATLRLPYQADLCREGDVICGQALLAVADTAMVVAISAASDGYRPMATVDMTTQMMRPVQAMDVIAEACVMRLGRTMAFGEVKLYKSDSGSPSNLVANASVTYALV